ncbi:MAG: hypothetical protein VKJ06_00755 [Vampirovibrionales bacterium]|nr:hypothetical protein [Vampirovibrionales bacterium]
MPDRFALQKTQQLLHKAWKAFGLSSLLIAALLCAFNPAAAGYWLAGCGLGVLFWRPLQLGLIAPSAHLPGKLLGFQWGGSLLRMAGFALAVVLIGHGPNLGWVIAGLISFQVVLILLAALDALPERFKPARTKPALGEQKAATPE